jgi:hypothetical protein
MALLASQELKCMSVRPVTVLAAAVDSGGVRSNHTTCVRGEQAEPAEIAESPEIAEPPEILADVAVSRDTNILRRWSKSGLRLFHGFGIQHAVFRIGSMLC